MFKLAYQKGSALEILSTQGNDSIKNWKLGNSKKDFDKDMKGYISNLPSDLTMIELPKDEKQSLAIGMPYLVL